MLFALSLAWAICPVEDVSTAQRADVERVAQTRQTELQARDDALLLVVPGDLPLVIAAPHGGGLRPEAWPVREGGVLVRDTNTFPLAVALAEAIRRRTGQQPSLIASKVHRRHLDLNRDAKQAGAEQGAAQAQLWKDYHGSIELACQEAQQRGDGRALMIDLHGHGHAHGLIELGFAVSAQTLRQTDADLVDAAWIRGPTSLGAELDRRGWKSVPSPARPAPELGQEYFNGGYTVRRHRGEGLRSIQIELPPHPRRLRAEQRQELVDGLAEAILAVLAHEFGIPSLPLMVTSSAELVLYGPAAQAWEPALPRRLRMFADALPQAIDVFGIPVLATKDVTAEAHQAAAKTLALRLDRNADGQIDDVMNALELQRAGYAVLLYRTHAPELPPAVNRGDWKTLTVAQIDRFEPQLDPRVPRVPQETD